MKEYLIKKSNGKYRILWMNRHDDAKLFVPDAVEVYCVTDKIMYKA